MIIRELRMKNFGKFSYKNINFNKGINIVYGCNEAGKTTTHAFIKSMLFGIEGQYGASDGENLYEMYKPWERDYDFSGSMKVDDEGNTYNISRVFSEENQKVECINETTKVSTELDITDNLPFISGITESAYRNTLSNEQSTMKINKNMAIELRRYIANLATSKNKNIDVANGLKILNNKRKTIKSFKTEEKVIELRDKVACDERDSQREKILSAKKADLLKQLEKAPTDKEEKSISIINEYVNGFDDIKDKYKKYQELTDQRKIMVDINDRLDEPESTAYKKFPILLIAISLIIVLIVLITLGTKIVGICASVGVVFLSGAVMYLFNDRVTEYLVTRECERRMADEQYARETLDSFNAQIVEKQGEILEYAKRVYPLSELNDESMFKLEQEINVLKNQVEGYVCRNNKSEQNIRLELERINWELERLNDDARFREERKKKYTELSAKLIEEEKDIEAIELAISTIESIAAKISGGFGAELNPVISEFCRRITKDKYTDIIIDDSFDIKVYEKERYVKLESLSMGAVEQIYLAVRLAAAQVLDKDNIIPMVFDDAFAYYDDERLKAALEVISDIKDRQIVLFTCQKREQTILKEENIEFSLIEL